MKKIKLIFEDNYTGTVYMNGTSENIRKHYIGKLFNVDLEGLKKKVIDIKIIK
jgi:hypothetical protein